MSDFWDTLKSAARIAKFSLDMMSPRLAREAELGDSMAQKTLEKELRRAGIIDKPLEAYRFIDRSISLSDRLMQLQYRPGQSDFEPLEYVHAMASAGFEWAQWAYDHAFETGRSAFCPWPRGGQCIVLSKQIDGEPWWSLIRRDSNYSYPDFDVSVKSAEGWIESEIIEEDAVLLMLTAWEDSSDPKRSRFSDMVLEWLHSAEDVRELEDRLRIASEQIDQLHRFHGPDYDIGDVVDLRLLPKWGPPPVFPGPADELWSGAADELWSWDADAVLYGDHIPDDMELMSREDFVDEMKSLYTDLTQRRRDMERQDVERQANGDEE